MRRHNTRLAATLLALMASAASGKTIHVGPGGNAQEKLQTAFIEAHPGFHRAEGRGRRRADHVGCGGDARSGH